MRGKEKKTGVDKAELLSTLREKVKESGRRFTYKIRERGLSLADAFSGLDIKSFSVDFDPACRAITLQVRLSGDDYDVYSLRTEVGSKTGVVDVSILRDDNRLFTGTDRLDTLRDNMESLFREEERREKEGQKDGAETQKGSPKDEWREKAIPVGSLLKILQGVSHPDEEAVLALSDNIDDIVKARGVEQHFIGGKALCELVWDVGGRPLSARGIIFDIYWQLNHWVFREDSPVVIRGNEKNRNFRYVANVTDNGEAAIIRCGEIEGNIN